MDERSARADGHSAQAYECYSGSPFSREIDLRAAACSLSVPPQRRARIGLGLEIHDGQSRSTVCGNPQTGSIAITSDCRAQHFVSAPNLAEDVLC
jgi:hypothetical protein